MTDRLPIEIREARINALNDVLRDEGAMFPVDILLPGGVVGGRTFPAVNAAFTGREKLADALRGARDRLVDDGVLIHRRDDGTIQLLDRDFAPLSWGSEARPARQGWLGDTRGWLAGVQRGA